MRALVIAIALLLPGPAVAQVGGLDWAYCRLWPSKCVAPAPTTAVPVIVAPPVVTPLPPERPAVTQPAPPVARKATRLPVQPNYRPAPKAKRAAFAREAGPDLPWPCWQVRLGALGKTKAELKAEGRAKGVQLTPKQIRQAEACLASK